MFCWYFPQSGNKLSSYSKHSGLEGGTLPIGNQNLLLQFKGVLSGLSVVCNNKKINQIKKIKDDWFFFCNFVGFDTYKCLPFNFCKFASYDFQYILHTKIMFHKINFLGVYECSRQKQSEGHPLQGWTILDHYLKNSYNEI